jgi:hypothetical protein
MARAILPALLAALGYALLELAFFVPRNHLLPWAGEHVTLGLVFFALHSVPALFAVVVAGLFARAAMRSVAETLPAFAPIGLLVAIHAISHYRERVNSLPRDVAGTAVTLAILVGFAAATVLLAWAFRRRPRPGRLVADGLATVLVLVGIARVIVASPVGEAKPSTPRPETDQLAVLEPGSRVFVFGFDGATWDVLDPMIAEGKLPNLAALAVRGRTFVLETFRPTFSPVIWTSVSTGKNRFQHGIHDVVQTALPGGTRLHRSIERTAFYTKTAGVPFRILDAGHKLSLSPYHSDQVRVSSVFDAAAEAGLSVTEIEWYVSWPARPLTGVTVSDRFHLQAPDGEGIPGVVWPEALAPALRKHVVPLDEVGLDRVREFVDADDLTEAEWEAWAAERASFVEEMRLNLVRDLTTRNVAVDLLQRDASWDLFAVYFRAVDLTHHLTWRLRGKTGDPRQDPELRLLPVIERYHEFMDGIVGDVLAEVPDDAVVLMLSDHGFEDLYAHSRAPEGFAILAGGPIAPATERGRFDVYDVAPTVAALLGLPVADDLEAGPRTDLFDPTYRRAHPVRSVSTWDRADRTGGEPGLETPDDAALREAEVERLRALGYIQ